MKIGSAGQSEPWNGKAFVSVCGVNRLAKLIGIAILLRSEAGGVGKSTVEQSVRSLATSPQSHDRTARTCRRRSGSTSTARIRPTSATASGSLTKMSSEPSERINDRFSVRSDSVPRTAPRTSATME